MAENSKKKSYSFCSKSMPALGKSERVKKICGRIVEKFAKNCLVSMFVIDAPTDLLMTDFFIVLDTTIAHDLNRLTEEIMF